MKDITHEEDILCNRWRCLTVLCGTISWTVETRKTHIRDKYLTRFYENELHLN